VDPADYILNLILKFDTGKKSYVQRWKYLPKKKNVGSIFELNQTFQTNESMMNMIYR
jgi:hypothetical protein